MPHEPPASRELYRVLGPPGVGNGGAEAGCLRGGIIGWRASAVVSVGECSGEQAAYGEGRGSGGTTAESRKYDLLLRALDGSQRNVAVRYMRGRGWEGGSLSPGRSRPWRRVVRAAAGREDRSRRRRCAGDHSDVA